MTEHHPVPGEPPASPDPAAPEPAPTPAADPPSEPPSEPPVPEATAASAAGASGPSPAEALPASAASASDAPTAANDSEVLGDATPPGLNDPIPEATSESPTAPADAPAEAAGRAEAAGSPAGGDDSEVAGAATASGADDSTARPVAGTGERADDTPAESAEVRGEVPGGQPTVGQAQPAGEPDGGAPAGVGETVGASVGDGATARIPGPTPGGDVPPGGPGGATAAGFPAGGVPPSSGSWSAFSGRRLARSSQRKVIAGVAGGLGEYTGIDPVLFRVLFAVLTLFGGSGILLYVVGWLFMPAEDEQSSPVESLLHRGPGGSNRARDAVAAAALVIAGLVLAGVLALGDARDLALVLVVVGGAVFLVRNLQERRDGGPPQPVVPAPAPPPPAPYETPLPTYQPQPAYQPPPPYPPVQHAAPTVTLPPPPAAPAPPREHSALGVITICLLLVVLGVAAALTASGAIDPEADDLLAVSVGTIGAGLLVGAWFGRARWLTWLGIPLLVGLIVVSTSNVSFKGGVGDRRYDPSTAAEIQPEYRVGVGNIRLDLSDVDLSKQLVRTKVSAGVGNIEVIVPRTADVVVDGRAGIGEVDLLGQVANGTSAQRSVVDHGPGGDSTIDLNLDLDVSIGRVEVDRATA